MENSIAQIAAAGIVILLLAFFIDRIKSYFKVARIHKFSLDIKKEEDSAEHILYKMIRGFSSFLKNLVLFNKVVLPYEKYLDKQDKIKEGMEVLAIKIMLSLSILFLYIVSISLYQTNFSLKVALFLFLISFNIPDVYLFCRTKYRSDKEYSEMLSVVIVMNNALKANKSIEQALEQTINRLEGKTKSELEKVKYDMKVGLTIEEAFLRMYSRTKQNSAKQMAESLALTTKSGANLISIFDTLEKNLTEEETLHNEIEEINKGNKLLKNSLFFLPFVGIFFLLCIRPEYQVIVTGQYKVIAGLTLGVLYILYCIILQVLAGGNPYE